MSALVLTAILAVIWLLFVALGYWHGGWREIVALAGILLSSAVLSEWAGPNGRDLSGAFGWSLNRAVTGVALAYLIGGTAILGYLGSMLFPRHYPVSSRERLFGALVGVLNGGLLLALALRVLRAYAYAPGTGKALHDSSLSRFLIEDVGYILMAALVIGIGAIVVGLILSLRRTAAEESPEAEGGIEPHPGITQPAIPGVAAATAGMATPVPALAHSAAALATPDPYPAAPVIDWPATPPPGMPVPVTLPVEAEAAPVALTQSIPVRPQSAAPASLERPHLPARIPPPMWFPVETLMARNTGNQSAAPAPVAVEQLPQPTPVIPPALPAMPATPPPGAPVVMPPPVVPPADEVHEDERIVVREIDLATRDSVPLSPLPTTAPEAETQADAAMPRSTDAEMRSERGSAIDGAPVAPPAPTTDAEASTAPAESPAHLIVPVPVAESAAAVPPSRGETAVTATAALPALTPPPSPSIAPPPEVSRPRGTYARVAQTRQSSSQPPPPAPQPPRQPGEEQPLQPPIPTGPDVHPCPSCGYPVRAHARFCPNCGARLTR